MESSPLKSFDGIKYLTYYYWNGKKFDGLPYEHNTTVNFNKSVLYYSIRTILMSNYHAFLKKSGEYLILYIDDKSFKQR